jgi:hypothetical protein
VIDEMIDWLLNDGDRKKFVGRVNLVTCTFTTDVHSPPVPRYYLKKEMEREIKNKRWKLRWKLTHFIDFDVKAEVEASCFPPPCRSKAVTQHGVSAARDGSRVRRKENTTIFQAATRK